MKVNEANVCLDCDELHSDIECPKCLSRSFHSLSAKVKDSDGQVVAPPWFEPLHRFGDRKKEVIHGRATSNNNLQEKPEAGLLFVDRAGIRSRPANVISRYGNREIPPSEQKRPDENNQNEPLKSQTYIGYNSNGVRVAFKCSLPQRRHWAHASYARIIKMVSGLLKKGFVLSREKYHSRHKDPQILPANLTKLEGSVEQVQWRS